MMALVSVATVAADRQFTYPDDAEPVLWLGYSKAETYDIAIRIDNKELVGKQIKGISVYVPAAAELTAPTAWLTSELKLSGKKNAPDIVSVDASIADGILTATFTEPYTITADGVYVGYSVTVPNVKIEENKNPIAVSYCSVPNSMFIHTSRTELKWYDFNAAQGAGSCMEVSLSGDFADYAVGVLSASDVRNTYDAESAQTSVKLTNLSVEAITSINYSVVFGNDKANVYKGSMTLETPISAQFGSTATVELPMPAQTSSCAYTVSVDRVNGHDNALASSSATAQYICMNFIPVNRPLMEEYTGLWCKFCPRGLVAMEEMTSLYGNDFVCISYHYGDILQYVDITPNDVSGYPAAYMNRAAEIDPWYADKDDGFNIPSYWNNLRKKDINADIDVTLSWADEAHTKLNCHSTVRFTEDVNGDNYRINYVLTGDGFKTRIVYDENGNPDFANSVLLAQSNYYSGKEPLDDYPLWQQLVTGGSEVYDLTFNDVAIANDNIKGVKALPAKVNANEYYDHNYEYDFAEIARTNSENGKAPIIATDLRCVAVLLTANGEFVNCNRSAALELASVSNIIDNNALTVSSEWYDLQGRRVTSPSKGLYIRVDRMADGSTKRTKTLCR